MSRNNVDIDEAGVEPAEKGEAVKEEENTLKKAAQKAESAADVRLLSIRSSLQDGLIIFDNYSTRRHSKWCTIISLNAKKNGLSLTHLEFEFNPPTTNSDIDVTGGGGPPRVINISPVTAR